MPTCPQRTCYTIVVSVLSMGLLSACGNAPQTTAAPPPVPAIAVVESGPAAAHEPSTVKAAVPAKPHPEVEPAPTCGNCGVVTDIQAIKAAGPSSGGGAVAGGIAGIIIGNQIGGGNGRTIAKIAGAAGGAYVGNRIEKRVRSETTYDVTVKLDNGSSTTLNLDSVPTVSVGTAVRVTDGTVVAR
jgi:outer membrane lipoprotein SlyB